MGTVPANSWGIIECLDCKSPFRKRSSRHFRCDKCRVDKKREIKRAWAAENPPAPEYVRAREAVRVERAIAAAKITSKSQAIGMGDLSAPINLAWHIWVSVPFNWNGSKNASHNMRAGGGFYTKPAMKAFRDGIIAEVRSSLSASAVRIAQNKIWIDIFVQKNSNKGDAVNFVDGVCDALKKALDLDDRWFSIRRVDWQIVKNDGAIFIGFGQESTVDVQSCHRCGRILEMTNFYKSRGNKSGFGRECKDCARGITISEME